MDRKISREQLRARWLKRILAGTGVALIFGLIIGFAPRIFTPTIQDLERSLDTVSRRTVLLTTQASGTVIPAYHEIVTAPYTSSITRVLASAGDTVGPQDTLICLDTHKIEEALAKAKWELRKKQNNAAKIEEELNQKTIQLKAQLAADSLKQLQLKQSLEKQKKLLAMGGSSKEAVAAMATDLKLATLQVQEKKASFLSFKRIVARDMENLQLEEQLKLQEVNRYQEQLSASSIAPERQSLLLSLKGATGQQITEGTEIAQLAGLSNFRIKGSLHGQHADKIFQGQKAQIIAASDTLEATVRSISPNMDNGSIGFTLHLTENQHNSLRHNMPVEVYLITQEMKHVLVLPNRLLTASESYNEIFVLNGHELKKRRVLIGGTSYKWAVIKEGLQEGDVVLNDLSRTQKYNKNSRIKWK